MNWRKLNSIINKIDNIEFVNGITIIELVEGFRKVNKFKREVFLTKPIYIPKQVNNKYVIMTTYDNIKQEILESLGIDTTLLHEDILKLYKIIMINKGLVNLYNYIKLSGVTYLIFPDVFSFFLNYTTLLTLNMRPLITRKDQLKITYDTHETVTDEKPQFNPLFEFTIISKNNKLIIKDKYLHKYIDSFKEKYEIKPNYYNIFVKDTTLRPIKLKSIIKEFMKS